MGGRIAQCLEAVFNQTFPPCEVIIVDGHSTDDTLKIAENYNVKIMYEEYGTRAGANQIGIENAKGDFIAFTDADCIPCSDWLAKLLAEMKKDIIGAGGCVVNIGGTIWENSINLTQNTFLGSANSIQGRIFNQKKIVKSISGCNSLYRKSDLFVAGGFNINLHTAEDAELNRRLLKYGKLIYVPDAVVIHNHGRGVLDFARRMRQYGYGRAESFLFDLQVVPPILALGSIIFIFINIYLTIYLLTIYLILIFSFTLKLVLNNGKIKYFITIPVIFFIEHLFYTIGFWQGILSLISKAVH